MAEECEEYAIVIVGKCIEDMKQTGSLDFLGRGISVGMEAMSKLVTCRNKCSVTF